jgi:hypothetical protein
VIRLWRKKNMPSIAHVGKVAVGVIAGSFAVGPVLGLLNIPREDGFGLDDVAAAAVIALAIIMVGRVL